VRWVIRLPLELWYYTVGKLFKYVSELGGEVVGWLLDVSGFNALMDSTMKAIFGDDWKKEFAKFAVKAIMWLYGISIDPLAKGAEMFNNLFTGAAVALNYHCHLYLGCRTLTAQQSTIIGLHLQQEARDDMALTPLKDRLFSTDISDSLTSTLIRNAPADGSPGTVMASLFGQVAKLPSLMVTAFSPKVRAASFQQYSDAAGVQWYGALPTDLAQDVSPEVRQQPDGQVKCPKTDPTKEFNACQADTNVIKGLFCQTEPAANCPEFTGTQ
jgi:hypothetical protein